ncbi:GUN4 domain-containing protein [Nostoc sp. FACHB-87]|uniref:GUN4 domain-containing protein n=1 Tax=Nostocaceae TaxID=1162 RepID=UPI001684436A|nr:MULTISPECIES: GUN4 domain-containing protein [Nostocaceae]MBD2457701.1 GUN4 domain-containing protein [Nostoc sp. FACHB-87]MBD2478836.1 GUN4 domain-containing protein [Anabaena sp. FACHB-83]
MKILHLDLKPVGDQYAEFRFFWDNLNDYQSRQLPLAEIAFLIEKAETDYYTRLPEDYAKTGQALYNWLDGSSRNLQREIDKYWRDGIVLAIAATERLAHLPWELLHDGKCFLVEKTPPIIPVRWISDGQPIVTVDHPQNRPLNVLFMATSPLGVKPELDYEAEEGKILEATKRTPVNLRVEESGCLTELSYVVREYETGYFDVFHLTGHATYQYGKPCFLTEDEYGNRVDSSTDAIAKAMMPCLPVLIFLSGCLTGYSSDGEVPSMAEELLSMGATAVLGWGERVKDTDANVAAGQLYWDLSQGGTLTQAIASAYQKLIEQKVPDWHKLRLYVANTLPGALVTPLRVPRRKQLPKPSNEVEFRDDEKRLRVATRENFVGRRRQLQNCLRILKTDFDKVGVLIHGMGGWGKSSIASRLWDRLPEHEKILWWRQIDESYLIKKLKDKLINPSQVELISYLENSNISFKARLSYLFNQLAQMGEKTFLLILDDFEWNLETREGKYILKAQVAPILAALVQAIQETGTNNRMIITCRYDFDSDLLKFFYKQGLQPLKNAELTKKLSRLPNFISDNLSEDLRKRALDLADGNPRLLEFINNEVLNKPDREGKIKELEENPKLWKERIIWEELYQMIDEPLQRILSYCLIYEIPVPMVALEEVCQPFSNYQRQLKRGQQLGLLEVSAEPEESNRVYNVSRIIPRIIHSIHIPQAADCYLVYQKAHEKLHKLWANKKNRSEEKWREIFRLKFANKKNENRFRHGFYQMLEVQYNPEADKAYELELRKVAHELIRDKQCNLLQNSLKNKNWEEADVETAWIFYQIMVQENYENWYVLLKKISGDTLKEINQLWLQYSNNQFGISIQMEIYRSLGGTEEYNQDIWEKFCHRIGWNKEQRRGLKYNEIIENINMMSENNSGVFLVSLPALIYTRSGVSGVPPKEYSVFGGVPPSEHFGFGAVPQVQHYAWCGFGFWNLFSVTEGFKL